jgi:LacI family transcriptional regulator
MAGAEKRKRPTLKDLADRTGFARGTVSMALNDDQRISEGTRKKVKQAMADIGYRPNEAARRLRGGKAGAIAFIFPRFSSAFAMTILSAAEESAYENRKYHQGIMPFSTWDIHDERDRLLDNIMHSRRADAVVMVTSSMPEEFIQEFRAEGIPVISVEFSVPGAYSIMVDNVKGGSIAAEYLLSKYGSDTAIVTGVLQMEKGKGLHPSAIDRLSGFKSGLAIKGASLAENRIRQVQSYSREDGVAVMKDMLSKGRLPRSIFCAAGDETAIGLIEVAMKNGLKVPEDIAILGYDDLPIASLMTPALSTIRQPLHEIGRLAYQAAVDAIERKVQTEGIKVVIPELAVRKTA